MNGKRSEPAKIMTHFESDYGAAPMVKMKLEERQEILKSQQEAQRTLSLSAMRDGHFPPVINLPVFQELRRCLVGTGWYIDPDSTHAAPLCTNQVSGAVANDRLGSRLQSYIRVVDQAVIVCLSWSNP